MLVFWIRAGTKITFEPDVVIVCEIVPVTDFFPGAVEVEKVEAGFVDSELIREWRIGRAVCCRVAGEPEIPVATETRDFVFNDPVSESRFRGFSLKPNNSIFFFDDRFVSRRRNRKKGEKEER